MNTSPASAVVVMPAYQEHEGIVDFLKEIDAHLGPCVRSLQFVVIDDSSPTPLAPVIRRGLPTMASRIHVFRNPSNLGHGPSVMLAYRCGLALTPDYVLHVDGDGQFFGADFPRVVAALLDHSVSCGTRQGRTDQWFRRVITGLLTYVLGTETITDVNTPLRAYRASELAARLSWVPEGALVPHIHLSMGEARRGGSCAAVPVQSRDRRGHSRTGSTWAGRRSLSLLPSGRLMAFCFKAGLEVWRARYTLLRQSHALSSVGRPPTAEAA